MYNYLVHYNTEHLCDIIMCEHMFNTSKYYKIEVCMSMYLYKKCI